MNSIKTILTLANNFGVKMAASQVLATIVRGSFIDKKFLHGKADKWKHEVAKKYLKENYRGFISSFEGSKVEQNINEDLPIWCFWAQGKNSAPPVVLTCIESIKKHNPNRKVILLDMNNYHEYVTLPDYIVEKQKKGNFSLTHFSDILRFTLLYQHGGIWFDATIFQSGNLYECIKDYEFFTLRGYDDKPYWTNFFVAGAKGNVVSKFMMEFFHIYWKNENTLIEYLLIDDVLKIGYEEIPTIKSCIDKIPILLHDEEIYKLYYTWFMKKWDKDVFKKLCDGAPIHKLSWKFSVRKYDYLTFYEKICSKYIS